MSYNAEQQFIGYCLDNSSYLAQTQVKVEHIENMDLRVILGACFKAFKAGAYNSMMIADQINQDDTGRDWFPLVIDTAKNGCGNGTIDAIEKTVIKDYRDRTAKQIGIVLSQSGDIDSAMGELIRLGNEEYSAKHVYTMAEAADLTLDKMERTLKGEDFGVKTGFIDLDKKLGCFTNDSYVVIGARASVGKTAFLLQFANNAIDNGDHGLIFSGEQSVTQIFQRMLAQTSRVKLGDIKTGEVMSDENKFPLVAAKLSYLSNNKTIIDDTPSPSINYIERKARQLKKEQDIKYIAVDYLQKIQPDAKFNSRNEAVADISERLKKLNRELGVPVIALAQLNRELEKRADKRPINSDLRESGSIEQDADVIMFLYRDEIYNDDPTNKGMAEIIIGKARDGEIGTIPLIWRAEYVSFNNFANAEMQQEMNSFD